MTDHKLSEFHPGGNEERVQKVLDHYEAQSEEGAVAEDAATEKLGQGIYSVMVIEDIKKAIQNNQIKITDHADEEAQADDLTFDEIYFTVLDGEIIEQYPDDKPYPSCLINGLTFSGDAVHSVWAFNKSSRWAVLITVYRPDPDRWIDFRTRKEE